MEHALRWINYQKLPTDFGYPMYVELDNIFPFIIDQSNRREKERIESERDAAEKSRKREEQIASDLAQMQRRS
jgi:hypothetical protein